MWEKKGPAGLVLSCHLQLHRTQLSRTVALLSPQLPGSHRNLGEVVSSEIYHPQLFYLLLQSQSRSTCSERTKQTNVLQPVPHCCLTCTATSKGLAPARPQDFDKTQSLWPGLIKGPFCHCGGRGTLALSVTPRAQGSAPCSRPTSTKASTQRSMSSSLCTAEICTRIRALPLGTTG